jgi:hypothetical protein
MPRFNAVAPTPQISTEQCTATIRNAVPTGENTLNSSVFVPNLSSLRVGGVFPTISEGNTPTSNKQTHNIFHGAEVKKSDNQNIFKVDDSASVVEHVGDLESPVNHMGVNSQAGFRRTWCTRLRESWPLIPMTQDGLPEFKCEGNSRTLLHRSFLVVTVFMSFASVFATDIVSASFEHAVDSDFALLLLFLVAYTWVEYFCFVAFLQGYKSSRFIVLDSLALIALCLELLIVWQDLDWVDGSPLAVLSNSHLKVLAAGRVARVGARVGKLSALRLFKPLAVSQRLVAHAQDTRELRAQQARVGRRAGVRASIAGQFGRRGFEDDRALYL